MTNIIISAFPGLGKSTLYNLITRIFDANNGEIVVAMTDENEVTLKRFFKEKNHIRLQPENDDLETIIINNVTILGNAIGLYRKI